jgi:hypothetical protein
MGPRADKHDDVYDRQIRLWGADAQVRYVVIVDLPCYSKDTTNNDTSSLSPVCSTNTHFL